MDEEKQVKKSLWSNVSPKLTFIFGICAGIAIFASVSLLYSFLALTKISGEKVAVNKVEENLPSPCPPIPESLEPTFTDTNKPICKKDGKPIIRLFSTTWCPHCVWIKETFDKVANDYIKKGKIVAYHWELDTGDNTLTKEAETSAPAEEDAVYQEFNPGGSIPTFVFGCRYYRIGNGYEREGECGLLKEEKEFRDLIEKLIKS